MTQPKRTCRKSNGYVKQWVALELTKDVSTLEPCAHFSAREHYIDLVIWHWHRVQSLSRVLKKGVFILESSVLGRLARY